MPKQINKINVALVFGGRSGEHEVSLQSAKSIYEALDNEKYNIFLVGIDKNGKWYLGDRANYLLNAENPKLIALNKANALEVTAVVHSDRTELINLQSGKEEGTIDVVFPITHGTFGEDGSLQGFLELLNVAYVGAGVLGSAVGMDKDVMKRLMNDAGIATAKYAPLKKHEVTKENLDVIVTELGFPMFVKPANLGSSVGISKAHDQHELAKAIAQAFEYDTKIVLETAINGREIELAVLGNDTPIASIPGEIKPTHEFYSYEAKYIDEKGAGLIIPADVTEEEKDLLQNTAIQAYIALECNGMARVDFFLTNQGEAILNEINTLPGFTKISMYPKLWEASGLPYAKLLDTLIELAIERKKEKDELKRQYD